MIKTLVFTIFLFASTTLGLVETLFKAQIDCNSGCYSNYAHNVLKFDACRDGCDFKSQNESCAEKCQLVSSQEQLQASCVVGCSMSQLIKKQKPVEITPINRPKLIIIFHLQRPSSFLFAHENTEQLINDAVKRIKEQPLSEEMQFLADPLQDLPPIKSTDDIVVGESNYLIVLKDDQHDHLQDLVKGIRSKWNQLIQKESKFSIWILLSLFLASSAILLYMLVSLCRHHTLSIRAQDLLVENELLHSTTPVKIKFENV